MGQTPIKAGLEIRKQARSVIDKVSSKFTPVTQLKALTYEEFLHEIELLNQITDELTKTADKTVQFSLAEGSDKKFLWKVSSKIVCEKVIRTSGVVTSSKLLSLRRFMRLYADIMIQLSAVSSASTTYLSDDVSQLDTEEQQNSAFCASLIIDGIDNTSMSSCDLEALNECCICMERECEVILSCMHGYCEQCINEWSETFRSPRIRDRDSTCPLCRNPLEDASHHWVVPEPGIPSADDMPALVLGLVDKAEGVCSTKHCAGDSGNGAGSSAMLEAAPSDDTLTTSSVADGYMLVSHTT